MASHFALFVDLENCGGKKSMLMDVIERVKIRGDILIGKVYGYTDSYSDLKEILLSNTFAVVPSLRFGRNQKNSLDIQLVIDALDVAYTNPLIDSFCIVSGDSDYVPLVGKLKTMGKFVLGISRSEAASGVFMNACSEFQFLESVASGKERAQGQEIEALTLADVNDLIVTILRESDSGEMLASEVKSVLLRLRPNFSEKSVGFSTFGKLIARLSQQFGAFSVESEQFNVIVSLNQPHVTAGEQITRENYIRIFSRILSEYKEDGFDRVNPSILKSAVQADYPDFTERQIGLRRFSDVLRALEKLGCTDRRQAVIVGDSLTSDLAAAKNARVDGVWYNPRRMDWPEGYENPYLKAEVTQLHDLLRYAPQGTENKDDRLHHRRKNHG